MTKKTSSIPGATKKLPTTARSRRGKAIKALAPASRAKAAPASALEIFKAAEPAAQASPRKKPKHVRDSFTMPKDEYEQLVGLKARAIGLGQPAKKSELLRAGVAALGRLSDDALADALRAVPRLTTGRQRDASNSKHKAPKSKSKSKA